MATEQYLRSFRLQVGSIEIESVSGSVALRVAFQIKRDSSRDPDEAVFAIYNLNESHRSELESNELVPLVFEAGYQDNVQQLFAGVVRRASSAREGRDWVTTLTLGDGESPAIQQARILKTYAKGSPLRTALRDFISATKLKEGNVSDVVQVAKMAGADTFPRGKTFAGPVLPELYRLVRSFGFGYTIQDGQFVFYSDRSETGSGVVLAPTSGLIGVPKLDSKGKLQCTALLNADLVPQRAVQLDAQAVSGTFVIDTATHYGDSFGADWSVDLMATPAVDRKRR